MSLAQILSRAVLIAVCTVGGYVLSNQLEWIEPKGIGLFLGFGLALFVLLIETVVKKFSVKLIIGGTIGLVVGLGIAFLISYPLGRFMDSVPMAVSVYLITACMFGYIGVTLGSGKISEVSYSRLSFLSQDEESQGMEKLLDTSALIDGRIADVVETGFIDGTLVVPRFVLNELQGVADSTDHLKRHRGRRGMEVLSRLKELSQVKLEVIDDNAAGEVDQQLISVAQKRRAAIVTTDYNLNQIARLQGVRVLNVNVLAQALRPVVLPGEVFKVKILKEGKSQGQGVGYLDDGTMVVIENARRHIGQTEEVSVTSVLQTPAGRMVFTELTKNGQFKQNQSSVD
ncbi:MAG: TRAM domain-containing protein [Deltaproteobacteria bacterium]|nr:TRAM domain-containing protein [Deltaproteobacteria bacterium]